ncbi:MAG: hypothetical protein QXI11_07220 [Thermoproteota archaeon]
MLCGKVSEGGGAKGPEEFSVDDVLRFLSIVKSPIYGRRGPAYHCKVVTALLKFMKTVGARSEVVEYLSGLLDSLSKEVMIYYDQKYLDEGFMRMRVLTDEERDRLVNTAYMLDSSIIKHRYFHPVVRRFVEKEIVDGEKRGWIRTCLIGLSARTFCRPIEIRRLLVRNVEVDNEENRLILRLRTAKRGNAVVKIVVDETVVEAVKRRLEWLAWKGFGGPYLPLFPGKGCPRKVDSEAEATFLTHTAMYNYAYEVYTTAGISYSYRPYYGFRRLGVIEMNEKNIPPVIIKEFMGWQRLDMIAYYYKKPRIKVADTVVKMLKKP